MKALSLQIIEKQQKPLEAIVLIECDEEEVAARKMAEIGYDTLDRLTYYRGKQETKHVETSLYGHNGFYVKTSGLPDYVWFVLKTVMERAEFRFSRAYYDYLAKGTKWGFLNQTLLDQYKEDLMDYAGLEDKKRKAVNEAMFEDAVPIRDQQRTMREKVYVAD